MRYSFEKNEILNSQSNISFQKPLSPFLVLYEY